jgi:ParB family chromosome partitioning protein
MNEQTIYIPLGTLEISELNVRRVEPTGIEELAALIKSQGLLQNLVVVSTFPGQNDCYEVIAGGRRLRALQLLAQRGDLDPDYLVPCVEVNQANAEQSSIAENSAREPMHPADEFEAFKRMHDAGAPIEDTAAAFGVSPLVVRRRLQLAKVSPKLISIYRAGGMNLETLQAFTLTDDRVLQEKAWDGAPEYNRNSYNIRAILTKGALEARSDRRAKFVGLDAYEAAGGTLRRDLFGGTDSGYIDDIALLEQLTTAKLEVIAAGLRAEGWSFVAVHPEIGYSETSSYGKSKPKTRALTDDESREIDELKESIDKADTKLQDDESDDLAQEEIDALEDTISNANNAIAGIRARTEEYSARQMKGSGVVMGITYHGTLEIHLGMIKPADKKEEAKRATASGEPVEKSDHSEALLRKLSANRTAAIAAHLLEAPRVALDYLCAQLATKVIYDASSYGYGQAGLMISAQPHLTALTQLADDVESGKAFAAINERRQQLLQMLPEKADGLFEWLSDRPVTDVIEILGFCTSSCLNAVAGVEGVQPMGDLAQAIGLDMSDWWQPTVQSYLGQVRKNVVIAAVSEVAGAHIAQSLDKLKKGDLGKKAEELLADSEWLPSVLRAPRPKKAAPAVKSNPAKKAALARKTAAKPETRQVAPAHDSAVAWPFPSGRA